MFKRLANYIYNLPKELRSSKSKSVFLFCLLLSTIFWLLIKLSKEHTTTINVPVVYTDFPEDKLLMNDLPNTLKVEITTYGFKLLRYKITGKRTAKLSVNELNTRIDENGGKSYWLPNTQKIVISKFFPPEVKLNSITPNKIVFDYSVLSEKRVAVKANVKLDLPKQLALSSPISISPNYVTVRGPKNVLDTLKYLYTNELIVTEKLLNPSQLISIRKNDQLRYEQDKVDVEIPIDVFTEVSVEVPITIINVPDKEELKLYPYKVKIKGLMAMGNYYELLPEDFEVVCDYKKVNINRNVAELDLVEYPEELSGIKLDPKEVEYLIFK